MPTMPSNRPNPPTSPHLRIAALVIFATAAQLTGAASSAAATLDRIKESGKLTLGYRTDASPFSFQDTSGGAAGYSVALCKRVADQVKADLALQSLSVEWVPVKLEERFDVLEQGKVDLLCGADTETLDRRKQVSFSLPIF